MNNQEIVSKLWNLSALRNKYFHPSYIAFIHQLSTDLTLNHWHHLKFSAEIPYNAQNIF